MSKLQEASRELIEAGGRSAQSFGLKRLLGQIYMFLYLRREAASLDDLVEGMGVSKASISIACRQLLALGGIKRVWRKGDRKDYYEAETDLRALLNNGILRELEKKLDSAHRQIERCREILDDDKKDSEGDAASETNREEENEDLAFFYERLDEAERYQKKVSGLLGNPILKKLL
jgi:DNA-binding transcriptional regulator GbsR (MarR family)